MKKHAFIESFGLTVPLIQAPMAGTSTPKMATAVSNAGALGSISVGATTPPLACQAIREVKAATRRPFNVNVFCHRPARRDERVERAWLQSLNPAFASFEAAAPRALTEIYHTFVNDDAMLAVLLEERPPVASFHFGLPPSDRIEALRAAGITLLATATSLAEAQAVSAAGVDAVVAQGYEAGGHRGVFDPDTEDDRLGTLALVRLLAASVDLPIIAAGGIMDGAGIAAAMQLGAVAAQLGTAFIACPESSADAGHRAALFSDAAHHTTVTRVISGRPARCLRNRFTNLGRSVPPDAIPTYPVAYDAGKALNAAAKAIGEFGYGAQWAGQGAPLARALPAADLVAALDAELKSTPA
jgi:nitronate monooxygenase